MIAKEGKILDMLEGKDKSFYIPVYQRRYSWTEDYCKRLLEDLENVINENLSSHYFGSIVYFNKDLAGISEYCIIDGQQRITTMYLLLLAIYKVLKIKINNNSEQLPDNYSIHNEIKGSYFYINPFKYNSGFKLTLTDEDDEDFKSLFKNEEVNSDSLIFKNYNYFYKYLNNFSFNEVMNLYDVLKKLIIVNVSLESNDDPQRIFESLNSKNLALKESDKIRNYLFMLVDYNEQRVLYTDYWKKIVSNTLDETKLIKIYLTLKMGEYISDRNLYFKFKDFMAELSYNHPKVILGEILKYSKYMKYINECTKNSKYNFQRILCRLNKLDYGTIYPFVFYLFDSFGTTTDGDNSKLSLSDLDEILTLVESYLARRVFVKLSTGQLNKIFAFLPIEISKMVENGANIKEVAIKSLLSKGGSSRFPQNIEFVSSFIEFELYNAKNTFKKYVFERIENFEHKEIIDVDNDLDNKILSIEHIMPQTLSVEWLNDLGSKYEEIHQKYINTIGNLTLTAYNSEYSNKTFIEKKMLEKYGFLYSNLSLNSYLKTQDSWGETQILERAQLLAEQALKIWPFPYSDEVSDFEILNPDTWNKVKITRLGREMFQYLLENELLTDEDVLNLKTKEKSKLILGASYPVLSNTREHEKGTKCHYAKNKYIYKNEELYLSYEWFEDQFDKLTSFLKCKLHL